MYWFGPLGTCFWASLARICWAWLQFWPSKACRLGFKARKAFFKVKERW